ncbi:MAG: exodeoxyribonuclease VII large subunit, partial [Candidatus Thiodiazotropha sp. (ex Notomyrtea botanica)]|nr:exodeoxyribonuclease VII large subunit [Candidatus Thiodiazotropha sp. (ex Notomyrtea botanica)]
QQLNERLQRTMKLQLEKARNRLGQLARDLRTLSPLNTLGRGYAIVSRSEDGRIVRSYKEVKRGEQVTARLSQGKLICQILDTENGK